MQTPNDSRIDSVKIESFYEAIDFPTEEELLAALDASLEQSPWMPRPTSEALDMTSRSLAYRWQNLDGATSETLRAEGDDHYLSSWMEDPISHRDITVEPDFLAGLAKFLTDRLVMRMGEIGQAQRQLMDELAKIQSGFKHNL